MPDGAGAHPCLVASLLIMGYSPLKDTEMVKCVKESGVPSKSMPGFLSDIPAPLVPTSTRHASPGPRGVSAHPWQPPSQGQPMARKRDRQEGPGEEV